MLSTGICRWLFLLVCLATWVSITSTKETRVVCYYTNWSVYRPGNGKFSPQNINPYLCTHLIYAFGGFTKENTLKPFDKYQDIEKGGYAKFNGLKTYNKDLKTLLAIGGWNEGSARFSSLVASPERRKEFAKNAIKFLRLNHFDGLDLDWEYPSFRDGGKPRDRDNYPLLVQELRQEFERESEKTGRQRLLLTMAVPAGIEYINKGFDVPELTKYLDWMNILSYDFHSAFEPTVNHHAPLYALEEESEYNFESDLNIDYAIKHYIKNGADPSKLVLGIPTYGRSYTLYNPDAFELGAPADGPGAMGEATRENGYLAYYEVCDYVKNQGWEVEQPNPDKMGPYAFKDNQWVGYDDEDIVRKKAKYVVKNGLGGIMFWSIDNDDFQGNCHGKPYPLIEAGRAALIEAYGITDDNLVDKTPKPIKSRVRSRTKTTNLNKIEESDAEEVVKPKKNTTRRRNRGRPTKEKTAEIEEVPKRKTRRKNPSQDEETSSYSSLKIVTPSYTTPAAPTASDSSDGGFKCKDDGFFPHPKDCKKYYWCLSGADDTIIAHQFTCPAGLYFNKAADSCDYSQNVLCKKPTQKPSTTKKPNESKSDKPESTTPAISLFTTRKPPPKITAATSRTTFRQTTSTTTEPYEEEEYDDEEEYEDEEDRKDSEEDPKVIKELIDLIKKAGGIEELEKQLNVKGNSTNSNFNSNSDSTTKSPLFSKSLYERVLNKAIKNSPGNSFRNSRGPQSLQTEAENEEKSESKVKTERGKLQYTSISRFRPTNTVKNEENNENTQKYTNIRRGRVSSTTNTPENDRNRVLGETTNEEEEDEDEEEDDVTDDEEYVLTTKKTFTPQYVNIRRQRPSTTEESSTSKYIELRRGTTTETTENIDKEEPSSTTSKYKILRRGTTTTTTTTTKPIESSSQLFSNKEKIEETTISENKIRSTTEATTEEQENEEEVVTKTIPQKENQNEYNISTITTTRTIDDIKPKNNSKSSFLNNFPRKRPQLFEPRPFEATTSRPKINITRNFSRGSTTTKSPSTRRTTRPSPLRRRYFTKNTTIKPIENQETTSTTPKSIFNRFEFISKRPSFIRRTFRPKSVVKQKNDTEIDSIAKPLEIRDVVVALKDIQNAPVPLKTPQYKHTKNTNKPHIKESTTINIGEITFTTSQPDYSSNYLPKIRSTTHSPPTKIHKTNHLPTHTIAYTIAFGSGTTTPDSRNVPSSPSFYAPQETSVQRIGIIDQLPEHSKVLVHTDGLIECLDQGNFPHPIYCKKFISCAKMENGRMIGWEYTCPKNLSFDPIGGICNWSGDLGCDEK